MEPDEVFSLERPKGSERHVVVEVPHAGLAVPDDLRPALRVAQADLLRDADLFIDRLWAGAAKQGCSLLVARVSRYVVDLNRAEDDVDRATVPDHPRPRPVQSRGVIWRTTTDGRAVLASPLSHAALEERLARYHRPYHVALAAEVEHKVRRFGQALVVCAHSMPSVSRPGAARRADVVPGSRGGSTVSPRVLDAIEAHFRDAGLSVRHDDPYKGGYTTQRYGRPGQGLHAVQIEINRALYVDERTSEPNERDVGRMTALIDGLLPKIAAIDLR